MEKFEGITTFVAGISMTKDSVQVPITVNLDWAGYTIDMAIRDLIAGQSPRVKIQAQVRNNGMPKDRTINIKMLELNANRRTIQQLTPAQALDMEFEAAKTDPVKRAALIARLEALDAVA